VPDLDAFAQTELAHLPDALQTLIRQAPLPDLDDGPRDQELSNQIAALTDNDFGELSPSQRALCRSGLWLLAGELDRSHTISQDIGAAEGSFWHGIMHRREGDFGNSKYWFRRVGEHPVLDRLPELTDGDYDDPYDFVDKCSRAVRGKSSEREDCRRTQWIEWQALMAHCIA